jgi:predicted nuclease of restriction endonuclease-like (RecB) superfamily
LNLYWELGREICEKQEKANWGDALIDQLAKDLSAAFPGVKGFSRRNLFYIKQWYIFYNDFEKVPQVVAQMGSISKKEEFENISQSVRQIPWGHNREIIMKCSTIEEALFYVHGTIQNDWSRVPSCIIGANRK